MGFKFGFKIDLKKTYTHKGVEYQSLDAMPPDVRALFKVAEEKVRVVPDAQSQEEDADDAEIEALPNLVEKSAKGSLAADAIPAHVGVDDAGVIVHRFAFMGYVYTLIPVGFLGAIMYIIFIK